MKEENYTLFACWSMFFWSISLRSVFFSLVPAIALTLNLSPSKSGFLVGAFFLGYSTAVWTSGFFPGSRKRVVLSGVLLSICAFMFMSALRSFTLFMLVAPLSSFGMGLYLPRGVSLIADVSRGHNLGRNMGIHEFAATVGLSLGPLFVGYALPRLSWENTLLAWGLVGVFALVVFTRVKPQGDSAWQVERKKQIEKKEQKVFIKEKEQERFVFDLTFIYLTLTACSMFMLLMGLISVLPIMLVEAWNLPPDHAASFMGWTRIAAIAGIFTAGILSDRHNRFRVLAYVLAAAFAALLTMGFSGFGALFTASLIFLFIAAAGTTPVFYAILAEFYEDRVRDRAVGIVSGTGSLLGVALAPAIFGYLIEQYKPPVTFMTAAGIVLAGLVAILLAERLHNKTISVTQDLTIS